MTRHLRAALWIVIGLALIVAAPVVVRAAPRGEVTQANVSAEHPVVREASAGR